MHNLHIEEVNLVTGADGEDPCTLAELTMAATCYSANEMNFFACYDAGKNAMVICRREEEQKQEARSKKQEIENYTYSHPGMDYRRGLNFVKK